SLAIRGHIAAAVLCGVLSITSYQVPLLLLPVTGILALISNAVLTPQEPAPFRKVAALFAVSIAAVVLYILLRYVIHAFFGVLGTRPIASPDVIISNLPQYLMSAIAPMLPKTVYHIVFPLHERTIYLGSALFLIGLMLWKSIYSEHRVKCL